ncbi:MULTISPECIES: serine hydrolase domain-containing protein [unclassified Saccharothrix]|uniref:serine hydrolase domain-containing protein n=1 Tax=unclassified Saccharothrix TaxID=2593673 RepID=UPI00307EB2B9
MTTSTALEPRKTRRLGAAALTVALLAGAAIPANAAPTHPTDRPELRKAVEAFADAGFLGIQVRLRDEKGEWVASAGRRSLDGTAKPPVDGRYRIGSTTKTIVATVVLQLVAEGRLGLDAPVADHLPRFGLDRRITTRMLLQHTSGLFSHTGEHYPNGTVVPGLPSTGKDWADNRFRTYHPDELVRFSLSKPPRFAPGTSFNYSNTNYTVAALLIEAVSGHSYADEVGRRVLRPLGMRDTVVPGSWSGLPGPHSRGYFRYQDGTAWKVVDVTRQDPSLLFGAGDMISTTADLGRFSAALQSGKLLPAPLLAEMRVADPTLGYGLGIFVQDLGPGCGTVLHHNGSPPGGYGSLMYSSADGKRTLTAGVTAGDADVNPGAALGQVLPQLLTAAFCDK